MNRRRPAAAVGRFLSWQVRSRLQEEIVHDWIGGAKLAVRRGMTGATGNVYCGLHEYVDMLFVLHALRPGDLFVDIGANVGSYTVLAAAVAGAKVVAFEPDPEAFAALQRNVELNRIADLVELHHCALGAEHGVASMTEGLGCTNHVVPVSNRSSRPVRLETLDRVLAGRQPAVIKIDVEGYEPQALAGARRTLIDTSWLALETEDRSAATFAALLSAGLEERFYDPCTHRLLVEAGPAASNALFIKGLDVFEERVQIPALAFSP